MTGPARTAVIETDAVIVGAGPAGIFQAFQLGLQEVHSHVIEALPHAGGQCVELYGDKPIYDIPGIAVCTGRELTDNLLKQVAPFKPTFHFNQLVSQLHREADGRWSLQTSGGQEFLTKTLFIAAGVGAFQPKALKVQGLDTFAGYQFHYQMPDAATLSGQQVLIVGDTESALQAAIDLATNAQASGCSVTLLHRREVFTAQEQTIANFRALQDAHRLQFLAAQITGVETIGQRLSGAVLLNAAGTFQTVPVDHIVSLQGLSPKLGPVAEWGLDMERRQLVVDAATFGCNQPGIFAVGDVNTYPGKKKLILCAFHECVLAAFAAMEYIAPEKKVLLQYTTTSTKLHALLGVENFQREAQNPQKTTL